MTFLIDLLAAVLGGVILIGAASILSNRARWILTTAASQWLDIDVEIVFRNKPSAQADLTRELERGGNVSILTGRGNELLREPFSGLFVGREKQRGILRVLLPNPDPSNTADAVDWISQREAEMRSFDSAYTGDLLRVQIRANIAFLQSSLAKGLLQLRLFSAPHLGRVVITERAAYFTPYRADAHGHKSKIYKFRRGEMYDGLVRMFEQLWSASSPPNAALP